MYLLHSKKIPTSYIEKIEKTSPGINRIPLPDKEEAYDSISSHPDIFVFQLDCKHLIYSRSLDEKTVNLLEKSNASLVQAKDVPKDIYPDTAKLNAVRIGGYVFHNTKFTDPSIKELARQKGLELVHVNQGYTRCSVIPVGENALITSDKSIEKTARKLKLDVEFIAPGNILLPGEEYGFIGGATGITQDGSVVFLGDITKHPDFIKINSFLTKHNKEYISLDNLPLYDAGSLIFIE